MKTIELTPKIIVKFPQSEDLCKKHDTNPRNMRKLYSAYETCFVTLIDHFYLNEVHFTFNIDNWRGAGIDTNFKLDLSWVERPEGYVTIYLGFPIEINSIIQKEIKHTLSHEFIHVLIFSYLTSYMDCAPQWLNRGYYLPDECKVPKVYIELLCDTLGLTSQYENAKFFLEKWLKEWNPNSSSHSGVYYFDENHLWAINFIEKELKFLQDTLSKKTNTFKIVNLWKTIFDHYFKSEEAKEYMDIISKVF